MNEQLVTTVAYFSGVLLLATIIPWLQARILVGRGSDQSAHIFLVRCIQENGYRLFSRVPHILNEALVGSIPLFIHWCLARLSFISLKKASVAINPFFNFLICAAGLTAILTLPLPAHVTPMEAGTATLLLALTPQYYHAFSARNFGISARSAGIFLFTLFYLTYFVAVAGAVQPLLLVGAVILGYLIIGTSTFATQAIVLSALPVAVLSGNLIILPTVLVSFVLFLAIHPGYGRTMLVHTIGFMDVYRREWAHIYLFRQRKSIWRDLVHDIWKMARMGSLDRAVSYAYGNAVLIVIFLNPLTIVGAVSFRHLAFDPFLHFCSMLAIIGLLMALLTSFRPTRFLGEPERYVEMTTVFGTISGTVALLHYQSYLPAVVGCGFALMDIIQLTIAVRLSRHMEKIIDKELDAACAAIEQAIPSQKVRFTSNSDTIIRFSLQRFWNYIQFWTYDRPFMGRTLTEAFNPYPFMRPEVLKDAIAAYGANVVVIDKAGWASYTVEETTLRGFNVIYEGPQYTTFIAS